MYKRQLYTPLAMTISKLLGEGFIHDILIGQLINGEIDYFQSMGLITTGIYVPFAAVLPYVFAFYLVLGFIEDAGYLPRLAILVDNVMHRMGLHGSAIIPMLLGLGCNVPGALSTRVLETKRQRFIAATLMAIAVPCMAQTAIIIGLVAVHGEIVLLMVFAVGDMLNPMNNSDSLFLILKSFISHFGFTVIGGMVFVFLYKYSIRLGIILALFTSISLHSIANYLFYLDGFQNLYCLFIGLIGIILLVKFIGYRI